MTSQPAISASSGSFPTNGALTPVWPSALATTGSSSNLANTLGVWVNNVSTTAPNKSVQLKLIGIS